MNIQDLVTADAVFELRATNKTEALLALCRVAAATLGLPFEDVFEPVLRREHLGSTGVGNGVAIPHARLKQVGKAFGALAVLKSPVEFGAIDEQPVHLACLLLLNDQSPASQLKPMACVVRHLRDPELVRRLLSASGPTQLYQALVSDERDAGRQ